MLYSVDSGCIVKRLPHEGDYKRWRKHLSDEDYNAILNELDKQIDVNSGKDIVTSSWIPGSDWEGTVYYPIYLACGKNPIQAGLFFGLILFKHLLDIEDRVWGFGKYEKNGVPIKGITYFILDKVPKK